jgi:uncharacterized protein YjbI with pentapeptide repeats
VNVYPFIEAEKRCRVLPGGRLCAGFGEPSRGKTIVWADSGLSVVSVTAKAARRMSLQKWGLWLAVAIPVTAVIIDVLIRSTLLALGAGLLAAGALIFTARSNRWAQRSLQVLQQGRVTDWHTKAVGKLGSKRLGARIGGVYALERVALGSPRDHPTVMEVLADFILKHSREKRPPTELAADDDRNARTTRPDVQAAVTVIGRRNHRNDSKPVNLNRADLTAANLTNANLTNAQLCAVQLTNANLSSADLADANLVRASLADANLVRTYLRGANLCDADLTSADLTSANLSNADLTSVPLVRADLTNANLACANLADAQLIRADLTNANLTYANLADAQLIRANLTNANLRGADLTHANLTHANLTNANLANALWTRESPMPKGWVLKAGSRRLQRATADRGNPG